MYYINTNTDIIQLLDKAVLKRSRKILKIISMLKRNALSVSVSLCLCLSLSLSLSLCLTLSLSLSHCLLYRLLSGWNVCPNTGTRDILVRAALPLFFRNIREVVSYSL